MRRVAAVAIIGMLLLGACGDASSSGTGVGATSTTVTTSTMTTTVTAMTLPTTTSSTAKSTEESPQRAPVTVIDQQSDFPEALDVPSEMYSILDGGTVLGITDLSTGATTKIDLQAELDIDPEYGGLNAVERIPSSNNVLIRYCCEPSVGTIHSFELDTGAIERVSFGGLGEGSLLDKIVIASPVVYVLGANGEPIGEQGLAASNADFETAGAASLSGQTLGELVYVSGGVTMVWLDLSSIDNISELGRRDLDIDPGWPSLALDANLTAWVSDGSNHVVAFTEDAETARVQSADW